MPPFTAHHINIRRVEQCFSIVSLVFIALLTLIIMLIILVIQFCALSQLFRVHASYLLVLLLALTRHYPLTLVLVIF